ncbi:hypothetical protein Hypma_013201 [Hypsizygus marmoreus]|uniref:Uncharacterized protein n=1 Tax=Hypsizygus marmoreus TaxID=39966 RepID=A0A369JD13_HYPMA|nr:hypothetical protein Hypma_013201 [Hypsizygus marmoreus]
MSFKTCFKNERVAAMAVDQYGVWDYTSSNTFQGLTPFRRSHRTLYRYCGASRAKSIPFSPDHLWNIT